MKSRPYRARWIRAGFPKKTGRTCKTNWPLNKQLFGRPNLEQAIKSAEEEAAGEIKLYTDAANQREAIRR